MYDVPFNRIDKKVAEVLVLVDLEKRKDDLVKTYSGGMRRRLEIARGMLHQPEILFLDEPTLGLDPQTRQHIWEYISILAKETGMTVVLTTHYMEEAEKLCNRVAIIDHGKIVALNTPEALIHMIGGDMVFLSGRDLRVEDIRKLPFVKKLEASEKGLRLSLENSGKNLQKLLQTAGETDFVEVHSPDLNDVFLFYTGKDIREGEGGVMEHIRNLSRARQSK